MSVERQATAIMVTIDILSVLQSCLCKTVVVASNDVSCYIIIAMFNV